MPRTHDTISAGSYGCKQPGLVIRSAEHADIDNCCELLAMLFAKEHEFTSEKERQRRGLGMILDNPSTGIVIVCEDTSNHSIPAMTVLLFTVSTALGKKVAILEDMIVDPSCRSLGIGSAMLRYALDLAEKKGLGRITLLTDGDNRRAHEFYRKNGFTRSDMTVFRKILD